MVAPTTKKFKIYCRAVPWCRRKQTIIVHKNGRFVNRPYDKILKSIVGVDVLDDPQKNKQIFVFKNQPVGEGFLLPKTKT